MHSSKVRAGGLGMEGAVGKGDAVTVVTGCGCRGYQGLVWLLPRRHPQVLALRIPPCGAAWFDSAAPRDKSSLAQPWTMLLQCPVPCLALAVLLRDQCPARGCGGHPNQRCCWGPEPQRRPLCGGGFCFAAGGGSLHAAWLALLQGCMARLPPLPLSAAGCSRLCPARSALAASPTRSSSQGNAWAGVGVLGSTSLATGHRCMPGCASALGDLWAAARLLVPTTW